MATFDPQDGASLDPRVLIGRIYAGTRNHYIINIYDFREDFRFSHCKSMETLDPRIGASLDPSGLIGRIFVGDH